MEAIQKKTPADAAEMLSEMSDENYQALMRIIVSVYNEDETVKGKKQQDLQKKQKAFAKMEELREKSRYYYGSDFDVEKERSEALEKKYGHFD